MTFFAESKTKCLSILVLLSFTQACVTTHVNQTHPLHAANLSMSCAYNPDFVNPSVASLTCSLENTAANWEELTISEVTFDDISEGRAASPEEISALASAHAVDKNKSDHNTKLALAGLIVVGLATMILAKDSTTRGVGAVAYGGGTAASAGKDITDKYNQNQYGKPFYSEDHLLGGTIRVPPNLAVRKHIVINHAGPRPDTMRVCLATKGCYPVSLK